MELHEYPRPANDTGIGVHWTVGFASAIGIGKIRDIWIPELKAMGVKWVKIFNHDGAIDFAELLLSEGIMPIVRLYRPSPNPSTLDIREVAHLDAYVRAGVRYFEFNHEPDLDSEWKGGRVPANAIDLVVENTIANMETILERGGMPGIPAVANGGRWDLVGKIVNHGRKDLFNGPVWQAIHNYARNRPLDYPYDIGNQEGASYTQRFYQTLANEQWDEDAWRGRSLHEVNQLRLERCNPGATIIDDNACWLAYEFFDARNRRHLGHSIPILSTECGYLVGEDGDARYPATTPDLHMAQTLEACRVMMGTSMRYQIAPDYYFCSAFWLLGNAALGSSSSWCESHAWISDRWAGGMLPIVRALRAEPKVVRRWQGAVLVGARAILHGTVLHAGDRHTLILEQAGREMARAMLDANSSYLMPDLLPGNYTLRVEGTAIEQAVNLLPGQENATVNLDLADVLTLSGSTLRGKVRGGGGAVVLLLRTSDGEEWVTMAKDDGSFRFVDLPPGAYNLRVQGEGSHVAGILLDGKNQRTVDLAVAGWGYTVQMIETTGARASSIRCVVENRPGVMVQVQSGEWSSAPAMTGSAPELGEDACEIGPLEPGYYVLEVEGVKDTTGKPQRLEAYVNVERRAIPLVEFVYTNLEQIASELQNSAIRGKVIGGCSPTRRLVVWLTDDQANRQEQAVGPDCTFRFEALRPGLYSVEIVGYAEIASRADIALDGKNTVVLEFFVPVEESFGAEPGQRAGTSVITGRALETAGRLAKLTDSVGNEFRQIVDAEDTFRFEGLAGGVYSVSVEGGYEQQELLVDGVSGLAVQFQPLVATWEVKVSPAGSMPGYSVVRVEVEGMRGLPVYIWREDWEGMMRRTGSKPEYGECAAEFSPLGPGHTMIEPEGLGIWADVELTGLEVVWIDFRRKAVPSSPNVVEPLTRPEVSPPPTRLMTLREWQDEPTFDEEGFDAESPNPGGPGASYASPYTTAPYDATPYDAAWSSQGRARAYESAADPVEYSTDSSSTFAGDDAGGFDQEFEPEFEASGQVRAGEIADDSSNDITDEAPAVGSPETGIGGDGDRDRNREPDDDAPAWLRSLATSTETPFTLPSLTRRNDDEDDEDDDAVQAAATGQPAELSAESSAPRARRPLCLLIPTPLTDVDDLRALLQFVATAQPVVAQTSAQVPNGSHVLLIGTTGTEEWAAIERELHSRHLTFEKATGKLSELFADLSDTGL